MAKKSYVSPTARVHYLKPAKLICTSSGVTESYADGANIDFDTPSNNTESYSSREFEW